MLPRQNLLISAESNLLIKIGDFIMKRILIAIFFIILGSAITMGIIFYLMPQKKEVKFETISAVPSKTAIFTTDDNGNYVPLNFSDASKKVMSAVVNVRSSQTLKSAGGRNQVPDAFREFFGEDFFRYYFVLKVKIRESRDHPKWLRESAQV